MARLDEDGFIYIVDRAKDIIIRGGENVYSVQVEAALFEHPGVADCAVIGVPEPTLGEEVGAVVVLRPGAKITADELALHVKSRLAAFMVPTHVWFRSEPLPRNPQGKVLKREIARRARRDPGAGLSFTSDPCGPDLGPAGPMAGTVPRAVEPQRLGCGVTLR